MASGKLTERVVLQKTKLDSLEQVKNLNVWGSSLEDVSIVKKMPAVEVLSLSVNRIRTLSVFSDCPNLKELYLRKNEIAHLDEVSYLRSLPHLTVLWLCDNPCSTHPLYRQYVVRMLPNLTKLDNIDVKSEERSQAARLPQHDIDAIKAARGNGVEASPTQSPSRGASRPSSDRSQRNVLTAVLALLNELSPASLEAVQQDISTRLKHGG
eukprot:TRINITY_DN421_c3_g1_i1.p2 TRINITY_DN421_c3_g1~~TRINITY_DN421_c3_g1_i1.p2  ORF type:complete len:210 (+),score=63.52 TRINITY_DN421_c3_g1_i1:243-872(+)